MFLSKMAEQDPTLRLDAFIVAACREFGWNCIRPGIEAADRERRQPNRAGRKSRSATSNGSAAFCCDKTADPDKSALARELCALAVERFCAPRPPTTGLLLVGAFGGNASVSETSLPAVAQGACCKRS